MKFDGKAFAKEIEEQVKNKVTNLAVMPKIVSVLVGDDPASALYTKLKKAAAERVGIDFEVVKLDILGNEISEIATRTDVTGLMIQLPVPGLQGQPLKDLLEQIPFSKDVDGLRYPESGVVPPVVKAILLILDKIANSQIPNSLPADATHQALQAGPILKSGTYVVVGASGFVGSALCMELEKRGLTVLKVDSETKNPADVTTRGDIVISCTGQEGMVSDDMVRDGAIVIDVGAPQGDMTSKVYQKASVSVEVPGGVGPVTIASLMENVVEVYGRFISKGS